MFFDAEWKRCGVLDGFDERRHTNGGKDRNVKRRTFLAQLHLEVRNGRIDVDGRKELSTLAIASDM